MPRVVTDYDPVLCGITPVVRLVTPLPYRSVRQWGLPSTFQEMKMHRSIGTTVGDRRTFLLSREFLTGFAALALLPLLLTACVSTTTATSPTTTDSIPSGWKAHTYGKAAIAVPSDWIVVPATSALSRRGRAPCCWGHRITLVRYVLPTRSR